ncbi:hypothetical protein [Sulfurirhabdus autotrophica]|nr:hypothetical protein [Sulfurirhabdus autotrophica]
MPKISTWKTKNLLKNTMKWLFSFFVLMVITSCASSPKVVDHAFGFDMRKDGQDAVVLDYRYGGSNLPIRAPEWAVKEGKTFASNGVQGSMNKGEFLYVKWRNTTTGKVYEDTVDLRQRLPADITNHTIYFMIHGAQLYVYLISPENAAKSSDKADYGPRVYRNRKIITIYPDHLN